MSEYVNALRDHYRNEARLKRIAYDVYYLTISDRQENITEDIMRVATRLGIANMEDPQASEVLRFAHEYYPRDWEKVLAGLQLLSESSCLLTPVCESCPCVSECPFPRLLTLPEFLRQYDKARF